MKFALELGAPMQDNLQRLASRQIDAAARALQRAAGGADGDPSARADAHERIYDARKSIKKLRALLRLFRHSLGPTYARENARLRDAGRALSALRDATALVEALDELVVAEPALADAAVADIRDQLVRRRDESLGDDAAMGELLRAAAAEVEAARPRAAHWSLASDGLAAIAPGFSHAYRQARRAMGGAHNDEARHEWRKRSKYHLYHVRLVRPLAPGWADKRRARMQSLTDALGEERDFGQLAAWLEARADFPGRRDLLTAIDRQRRGRVLRAEILGARLFETRPRKLRSRIGKGWTRRGKAAAG